MLMSLVKDAERIGDYGKNLFDLALLGRGVPEDAEDDLLEVREKLSRMLAKARNIYASEDEADARDFVAKAEALVKRCDAGAERMVLREDTDGRAAAGAFLNFNGTAGIPAQL